MFDVTKQLGVQSWCFREFKSLDALIGQIKGIGLSRTELCGVHADFNDEAAFDTVAAAFKNAGIQVTSLGVQGFGFEPAKEEAWFKLAQKLGATMISAAFNINTAPGHYAVAAKLADKYNINLGIHNHGGYDWLGSTTMLDWVFRNTSSRIGLCLDTAWCMQAGEDPIKAADRFADRLYSVHIKDFIFKPTGQGEDVVVGTGNLKLSELMAIVTGKAKNCKVVTLEYEGDEKNPGPKLAECVEKVKQAAR